MGGTSQELGQSQPGSWWTDARRRSLVKLAPIAVVALVLTVGLCVPRDRTGSRIAIIIPGSVRFFDVQVEAMNERAADHGVELVLFNAEWSAQTQLDLVDEAMRRDYDVVAMAPVDVAVAQQAVELENLDTPLLTFTNAIVDDPTGEFEGIAGYVGRNEFEAGLLLAEQVKALDLTHPRVLVIEGAPGSAPQRQRAAGYLAGTQEEPGWPAPIRSVTPNWDLAEVERTLDGELVDGTVDVVAAQWADAAVVASRYMQDHSLDIPIVTLEWTASLRAEMDAGYIRSSTYYSIREEGVAVIDAAMMLIEGDPGPIFVTIDQQLVPAGKGNHLDPEW